MPNWKKLEFKIAGKTKDGEEFTPLTIPMARLAEYITDIAEMLGHKDDVHLVTVEEGSAQPVAWIDDRVFTGAIEQMRAAQRGMGPKESNAACRRFRERLLADDGSTEVIDPELQAKVIEFPHIDKDRTLAIKPIKEAASIIGELRRVGGMDKTIHLLMRRADGEVISVECDEAFGKRLEGMLFKYIRVNGIATWSRDDFGNWNLDKFVGQSYDPEPLIDEPFATTIGRLRSLPGNKWGDIDDPFEELRKLRHGEDEPTQ